MLGVLVNPVAGMGGRVALHGTDGVWADRARERGAVPRAARRAGQVLAQIARSAPGTTVLAAAGEMGADPARAAGLTVEEVPRAGTGPTTARDTQEAARCMRDQGVELLLFAGGDGTARDVLAAVGTDVPVLGVPCGVKMHSAVFATTPRAAGALAARFLAAPGLPVAEREVVDVDPLSGSPVLHGSALVPHAADRLQRSKAGSAQDDDAALDALCRQLAGSLEPDRLYLVGPGTTTGRLLRALGLDGSLRGVDAVRGGRLVGRDLTERELLGLLAARGPASLFLGVVGGQGFLLGRGNQQLSAEVLRLVGDDVVILAGASKLAALDPPVLHVDLDDDAGPGTPLAGYRRVLTAPGTSTVLRVAG
ncbi:MULTISPECIES: ATP-NAD kinase family protein [unclassified Blastococcus]|uniref:ATP-NAD kinase family protein n=1 Tax=unclassified Blastococcus TaxID=2619396 RepID=UPI001EF11341|nr:MULTISPECIES: NAD(+)/NADH kinase [unclassified Blastococcus]